MTDAKNESILVMITREGMGNAEPALQQKVIRTYLTLLDESNTLPGAMCFYTDGVKLVVEGSPVLDLLRSLESKGVHLIVCKNCLDYFGLTDRVQVGIIGGMTDIIAAQWAAASVITI